MASRYNHSTFKVLVLISLCFASPSGFGAQTAREKAQALTAKAVPLVENDKAAEAVRMLNEALRTDPTVYEAHYWLGRLYARNAGSSQEAKLNAVKHFREAVSLQPYGDEGELSRAWLNKLSGRPKSMFVVPLAQGGEVQYDADNTLALASSIAQAARNEGFEALTYEEVQNVVPDKNCLKALALDAKGLPRTGWVVFVGAGQIDTSYLERRDTYSASVEGALWIGDALSYLMYPKIPISSSSFGVLDLLLKTKSDSSTSANDAMEYLSSLAWQKAQRVVSMVPDANLVDEMLVPLGVSGVYARSTAGTLDKAKRRPVVALYARAPDPVTDGSDSAGAEALALERELRQDSAKRVCTGIQSYILTERRLNVVSQSYTKELVDDAVADPEQIGRDITKSLDAQYALVIRFNTISATSKSGLLGVQRTIRATCTADCCLVSADGKVLFHEEVSGGAKRERWLQGDVVDVVLSARSEASSKFLGKTNEMIAKYLPIEPVDEKSSSH